MSASTNTPAAEAIRNSRKQEARAAKEAKAARSRGAKADREALAKIPFHERLEKRIGRSGASATALTGSLALKILTAAIAYVVGIYASTVVVPNLVVMVQANTGVTSENSMEALFAFWGMPSLFMIALLLMLMYAGIRAAWRLQRRLTQSFRGLVLGPRAAGDGRKAENA